MIRSARPIRHPALRAAAAGALALALAAPARAVEVEPDRVYPGGTRLEASDYGVSFTVPAGWQGVWPSGSEAFLLRPAADADVTLLALGEEWTRAEAEEAMAEAIPLDGSVVLQPTAAVEHRGRALVGRYRVAGTAPPLEAYAEVLPGDHGIAVAYLLMAPPDRLASFVPVVRTLSDETAFSAPAGAAVAAGGAGGGGSAADSGSQSWAAYLKGKYIVRYYTASGYTDETHLWLCSDGTFHRRGAAGGFGGGASGAFQGDSTGRWEATGRGANGRLILRYGDGSTATHDLFWDYQENELHVDGKRWLHDTNEVCD